MASSSSPAKQPLPNEVFISFRGEDTRNNFVSHLHSALKDKGIGTYFDEDSLQKGQTIGLELMKAIEESSIAIVVLSRNYGSSTWCLNELVKIMECKNKSSLIVFPIFYHVQPSDVRKQKKRFSEAFAKHEVDFKDDCQKVKRWREALRQVSDLAGEEIRRQNEASCIKEIGDKILKQLPVKASEFRKSCVGIESCILEIKNLMDSKPHEVLFIGLWGMGGIGKTTMARAIFEDRKEAFEGSCFLPDVKEKKNEIHILQNRLLYAVLKTDLEGIHDVVTGTSMIEERLRFKKVLLVIDDVDNRKQLNALAKQCDWFGKGSRIIITTRDEHLIDDVHIEKFKVHTLPENEALRLFSLHAFKNDHPHEDFKDLSPKVLSYVGGLPLALSVLGEYLHGQSRHFWESTLSRLSQNDHEDEIMNTLQISFEGLSVLQQNIFLDIACYFRGSLKDEVEERLQSLGLHPKEGIDVLSQRSLIDMRIVGTAIDGDIYDIEMHDLLQEMGWYIVRKRSEGDVRRYSRLWLEKDVLEVLSCITVPCEAERLVTRVNPKGRTKPNNLGWEVTFTNMSKLSYVEVTGDFFKGNYDVNVAQPFCQFGNKLRWFSWFSYPGKFLPKGFHPMNLVQLHMGFSQIIETPDFSYMPNLELLNLESSEMLVYVHPSLGTHMNIKNINLLGCQNLKEFPKIYEMKSLEFMDISYTNIQNFPEICGNLDSLRKLELEGTPINGLPKSILGVVSGLPKLKIYCGSPYKEDFTSLDVVGKSFPGLVSIVIRGSGIISTLDFSHLPYLEKLDLSFSRELVQVHPSLGVHKRIKSIDLSDCSKLEEFPLVVDMESLEKLDFSDTRLRNFPEMRGNVKRLVELYLNNTHITSLPWSIGCATSLQILRLEHCEYLLQLPITILGLQLEEIYIKSGSLKYFMENIDDEVGFSRSKRLRQWLGRQPSRSRIYFRNCKCLEELPDSLLSRIEILYIEDCPILMSWICLNLVALLDKYELLRSLRLHQECMDEGSTHESLRAFSEWEVIRNMLRKRERPFKVCLPGTKIPSWFHYQFSNSHSITMYLPQLSHWYTDKLRGFVLAYSTYGVHTDDPTIEPTSSNVFDSNDKCCYLEKLHLFLRYIPIAYVSGIMRDWNGEDECTLFEQTFETCPSLGFSLVYTEGEINETPPHQVTIVEDDDYCPPGFPTTLFRVKVAQR